MVSLAQANARNRYAAGMDDMITPTAVDPVPNSGVERQRAVGPGERMSGSPLDFVFRLPGARAIAGRMGRAELRRRLLHMTPGLLPLLLWAYPHSYPDWELPVRVWVCGLAIALAFFGLNRSREVLRDGETGWTDSVLWYSFSVIGALAIAPLHPEYCLMVLGILAFGDGSATLGGKMLGGPRLFWNRDKTWAGLLCFWTCGTVVATLAYWGEVKPQQAFWAAAGIAAMVTAAAALAESLPLKLNDNLRVGIATLVACETVIGGNKHALRMLIVGSIVVSLISLWRRRHPAGA
jgi:dolichol kinase